MPGPASAAFHTSKVSPAEWDRATVPLTPRAVVVNVCGEAAPAGALVTVTRSPFQSKSQGKFPAAVAMVGPLDVVTVSVPLAVVPTAVPPVTVIVPLAPARLVVVVARA